MTPNATPAIVRHRRGGASLVTLAALVTLGASLAMVNALGVLAHAQVSRDTTTEIGVLLGAHAHGPVARANTAE